MSAPTSEADTLGIPTEDPEEFPESSANIIREQAAYLDKVGTVAGLVAALQTLPLLGAGGAAALGASIVDNVEIMFDGVKALLGDFTTVRDLGLEWARLSTVPSDIRDSLRDEMGALDDYWEGVAFDSFSTHLDHVNEGLKDTSTKMVGIAKTLAAAITLVFDTWSSVIGHISKCATTIATLWNPSSISSALKSMADEISGVVTDAIKTMGGYVKNITDLEIDAVTFPELPDDPKTVESAGNTDGWGVKDAT